MDILNTVQAPNGNEQTMSSVEIAQVTGKSHGNVLKDIDKLNANVMNMWRLRHEAYIYLVLPTGTVNTVGS